MAINPMPKTNKEQLREIIIEAVPEIMELGFGCEVEYELQKYIIVGTALNRWQMVSNERNQFCRRSIVNEYTVGVNKIIGREITLFDIRMALMKHNKYDWGDCFREISAMWNDINDLSQQSEAVINLLLRILGGR